MFTPVISSPHVCNMPEPSLMINSILQTLTVFYKLKCKYVVSDRGFTVPLRDWTYISVGIYAQHVICTVCHSPLRTHIESSGKKLLLLQFLSHPTHFEVLLLKEMWQTLNVIFICVNDTIQTSMSITPAIRRSWVFY